ncbi:hypothetical protein CPB83DRAFT_843087 [Crepidotus variabilis]|uniref:Uncharacterized protein n=1 Tax=Crepidotus variabilis TaxID=179855 RepID=A0A9P6ERQ2_9AGAR|nr:hypothetical protein CPB83DRAFT_843087 [Crepidotus variabilis]
MIYYSLMLFLVILFAVHATPLQRSITYDHTTPTTFPQTGAKALRCQCQSNVKSDSSCQWALSAERRGQKLTAHCKTSITQSDLSLHRSTSPSIHNPFDYLSLLPTSSHTIIISYTKQRIFIFLGLLSIQPSWYLSGT